MFFVFWRGLRIHKLPLESSTICSGASCCTSMKANPVSEERSIKARKIGLEKDKRKAL